MPARMLVAALSIGWALLCCGADWRQFRGSESNAVAAGEAPPLSWDETENVAWKVPLQGRGLSGPIVIGNRVLVTCSSGFDQDRLHVICFSTTDGQTLWHRQFWATGSTSTHNKTCVAAPTPASDGQRVFAFFASNDLVCLDLDGNLLWYRGLGQEHPNATNSLGMASSPVVAADTVVVQLESDDDAVACGLNAQTGEERWKLARPRKANWTSPAVLTTTAPERTWVLLQSAAGLTAVVPQTGEIAWTYDSGASTVSSSAVAAGTVYTPSGGIVALRPPRAGDAPEVLWKSNVLAPSTITPVIDGDRIFTINSAGVLSCATTPEGARLWQLRLQGPFSSSPVAAGGYVYLFNEHGKGQVVKPGDKRGEVVGGGDLGETILCTPAIANGALYVRSDKHLWKLARK